MGISFVTDNKDLITFVYYVLSSVIQFSAFALGVLYVLRRDSRQRKKDERRREEEKTKQRLQEWRKFSQELNLKYIDMQRDKVIQRLQHANESLKVCISPGINGLDVLHYMINDEASFPNTIPHSDLFSAKQTLKPTALSELRLDLRSVFVLLNYCWSLCLLGEIPENFNEEMRRIVIELGNLALPFCSEESDKHRFRIIKECLKNFGDDPQIPQRKGREELTNELPYVKCLQYEPDKKTGKINFTCNIMDSKETLFTIHGNMQEALFLSELHAELVRDSEADYTLRFAKKMKEKNNEWIWENATDEEMVLKLIHDVRCIAWKTANSVPSLDTENEDLLKALKAVKEGGEVTLDVTHQGMVKQLIMYFKQHVVKFEKDGYENFQDLKMALDTLQGHFKKLKIPEFTNDE